ncbi:MAG: hypothetical protein JO281_05820 [Pseudonocardiales bacterium]|nr:hypothetical protein [Pseudonocardiales bacterium]
MLHLGPPWSGSAEPSAGAGGIAAADWHEDIFVAAGEPTQLAEASVEESDWSNSPALEGVCG